MFVCAACSSAFCDVVAALFCPQGSPGTGPAVPSASAARQQPPPPMPGGQRGEPSPHLAAQPRQFFDGSGERHFEQDFSQAAAPALVQRVRAMSFRSSPKSSPRTTPKVPKPGSAQPRGPVQDRWWVARKGQPCSLAHPYPAQLHTHTLPRLVEAISSRAADAISVGSNAFCSAVEGLGWVSSHFTRPIVLLWYWSPAIATCDKQRRRPC